jgi:hypothetical protein
MATAQTTPASKARTPRSAAKSTVRAKPAKRATTVKRATASRTTNSSASAKRSTQAVKNGTVSAYAERAVLIPVGAALIAREQVLARVNDTIGSYGTPSKANAQLRRFERRGNTARNRLEREVRKTRGRVEREVTRVKRDGEDLAGRVQERILSLV